jgi:hypothetical protein
MIQFYYCVEAPPVDLSSHPQDVLSDLPPEYVERRPFADPDVAAKIIEIANDVEAALNGRIYIERGW